MRPMVFCLNCWHISSCFPSAELPNWELSRPRKNLQVPTTFDLSWPTRSWWVVGYKIQGLFEWLFMCLSQKVDQWVENFAVPRSRILRHGMVHGNRWKKGIKPFCLWQNYWRKMQLPRDLRHESNWIKKVNDVPSKPRCASEPSSGSQNWDIRRIHL